jgi:predicted regulator of Ras-like GTPase activity (Roadblock/LC7/MglB family)
MAETGFGDYFIRDVEDDGADEVGVPVPVVVPQTQAAPVQAVQQPAAPQPAPEHPAPLQAPVAAEPSPAPAQPVPAPEVPEPPAPTPIGGGQRQREDQLARTLNAFLGTSPDVQAAALVSLDGFIIASALPRGMQEDRVGAMAAAILGLGERAAAELGRGRLTQVFIEGADGFVLLIAAGDRAVLTVLADKDAKLGLILYDMKAAATRIGEILR